MTKAIPYEPGGNDDLKDWTEPQLEYSWRPNRTVHFSEDLENYGPGPGPELNTQEELEEKWAEDELLSLVDEMDQRIYADSKEAGNEQDC